MILTLSIIVESNVWMINHRDVALVVYAIIFLNIDHGSSIYWSLI